MFQVKWTWIVAALLSALAMFALFPPLNWQVLAPVCLLPLLWMMQQVPDWRRRALLGLLSGAVFWGLHCPWIEFVLEVHGGMGLGGGIACFVLFCMYKGLQISTFCALGGMLFRTPYALLGLPALWVALDRTHEWSGFQWLSIGNAAIEMAVPMRLAPIGGVYLVTFLFVAINVALLLALLRRPRVEYAGILVLAGLMLLPEVPDPEKPTRTLAAVQPNQPVEHQWTARELADMYNQMAMQSLVIGGGRNPVDVVVWPESPASFSYDLDPEFAQLLQDTARRLNVPLLAGTVLHGGENEVRNSAVMLGPGGQLQATYDKVHLVPFGEFIPPFFGFVNRISDEVGTFVPGTRTAPLPLTADRKAAVIICYEAVFPRYVAGMVRDGANVIFNLSNDGYFGNSAAKQQHLLIARMRAAETQRWLVRVTNDGITASIDPAGRIAASLPANQFVTQRLPFRHRMNVTPYVQFTDWVVAVCAVVAAVLLWLAARNRTTPATPFGQ